MTLEPAESSSIPLGNPVTSKSSMSGNNNFPSSSDGLIAQKTVVSSEFPMNLRSPVSGFTSFTNGTPTKSSGHSCQGKGGAGCSCAGSCTNAAADPPVRQPITALTASNNSPTLEQVVKSLGKLSLVSSVKTTNPMINPPVSQSRGPCFELLHFNATESWDEIIEPGNDAFDVWVAIPCPTDWGTAGLEWGVGVPPGHPNDQIVNPSDPGVLVEPIDLIKINCADQPSKDLIKGILQKVLDKLKKGIVDLGDLVGCSDKINTFISCMLGQANDPKVPSITCNELPGQAAMHTDSKGNITIDLKQLEKSADFQGIPFSDLLEEDLMHEFAHACDVKELDAQIMTMMFFGIHDIDNNLTWEDPKTKRIRHDGTLGAIESESGLPDDAGIINGDFFSWNPSTGEVFCKNSNGLGKIIKGKGSVRVVQKGIISSQTGISG